MNTWICLVGIPSIWLKRRLLTFLVAAGCLAGFQCTRPGIFSGDLPGSVYFLDTINAETQIWKLEVNSLEVTMITDEVSGIDDFAVSPADGSTAYISGNKLYLWNQGKDSPILLADPDLSSPPPDYEYPAAVSDPSFSPDGRMLAYQLYGIRLYDTESKKDELILPSPGNLLGETYVFAKEYYYPGPWSPDGKMLLILMGYYEGSTLAVLEPGLQQPWRRLLSSGSVCCQFNWSEDSQSVLVANPYYTINPPGLWVYDAVTGQETELVNGIQEDGSLLFVGWPFLDTSDGLTYFSTIPATINDYLFTDHDITFKLMQRELTSSEPAPIRPEEFAVHEALWSGDGSFLIILQETETNRELVLVDISGGPLQVLYQGNQIRKITWGP